MLEAKRKVKEEERVIPPWIFQLFPFSTTAADRSYSPDLIISSPPYCMSLTPSGGQVFLFGPDIGLTNQFLNDTSRNRQYLSDPFLLCSHPPYTPSPHSKGWYLLSILMQSLGLAHLCSVLIVCVGGKGSLRSEDGARSFCPFTSPAQPQVFRVSVSVSKVCKFHPAVGRQLSMQDNYAGGVKISGHKLQSTGHLTMMPDLSKAITGPPVELLTAGEVQAHYQNRAGTVFSLPISLPWWQELCAQAKQGNLFLDDIT